MERTFSQAVQVACGAKRAARHDLQDRSHSACPGAKRRVPAAVRNSRQLGQAGEWRKALLKLSSRLLQAIRPWHVVLRPQRIPAEPMEAGRAVLMPQYWRLSPSSTLQQPAKQLARQTRSGSGARVPDSCTQCNATAAVPCCALQLPAAAELPAIAELLAAAELPAIAELPASSAHLEMSRANRFVKAAKRGRKAGGAMPPMI